MSFHFIKLYFNVGFEELAFEKLLVSDLFLFCEETEFSCNCFEIGSQ